MKHSEDHVRADQVTENLSAPPSKCNVHGSTPNGCVCLGSRYWMERAERLESALTESVRKEDLEHALERVVRLNSAVHVLYRVFEAASVLSEAWPGTSPNWEALREAVEAYRQLVAQLPNQGGADPGKPAVQP